MVSVIVPAYNRGDKAVQAVESVLRQTGPDLEVLVIDDGSTDDTRRRLSSVADPRLRYVYQEHAGACAARNRGVALATGEYVAFQDSDDLWRPRKLEKQLACIRETGADILCCRMAQRNAAGETLLFPAHLETGFLRENDALLGIGTQTLLARREVFAALPFDGDMPRLQEFEWLCRARRRYSIFYLNETLADYRPGGDSLSADAEKLAAACGLLRKKHPDLAERSPQTARMLAGRLRTDAEKACLSGNRTYQTCLREAAFWGGSREKRLARLEKRGLYKPYVRLRHWAKGQRDKRTPLWKAIVFPVGILKRGKRVLKEIREAEPVRAFGEKRAAFGAALAWKLALCKTVDILTDYHTSLYHKLLRRFCDSLFCEAAKKTAEQAHPPQSSAAPLPVWALWWDGEKAALPCVKMCLDSQKRHFTAPEYEFHLLDKDNCADSISLPPILAEKFKQGKITVIHLSDMLRAELLKRYGGLWVDATVYLSGPLDIRDLSGPLYTNRKTAYPRNLRRLVSAGRWTGYFLQTGPKNPLAAFLSDCFRLYWEKYDALIDYYLIDYVIDAACRLIPSVREMLDKVPVNNERIFDLFETRNRAYRPERVEALFQENRVHKLSYKYPWEQADEEGRMTVGQWLLEEADREV